MLNFLRMYFYQDMKNEISVVFPIFLNDKIGITNGTHEENNHESNNTDIESASDDSNSPIDEISAEYRIQSEVPVEVHVQNSYITQI